MVISAQYKQDLFFSTQRYCGFVFKVYVKQPWMLEITDDLQVRTDLTTDLHPTDTLTSLEKFPQKSLCSES